MNDKQRQLTSAKWMFFGLLLVFVASVIKNAMVLLGG